MKGRDFFIVKVSHWWITREEIFKIPKSGKTRPEVSEADPREPKGNKIRGFKVKTSTQKLKSQYIR